MALIYKLANIDRNNIERFFHKLFAPAQINLVIQDRFGNPVRPQEWFLVPISEIEEAVRLLKDGTLLSYYHDTKHAKLIKNK